MKKRGKIVCSVLVIILATFGGMFYAWAQKPSSRMLLSSIYFMEVTLKNWAICSIISTLWSCAKNMETRYDIDRKVGLSDVCRVKSSIYF